MATVEYTITGSDGQTYTLPAAGGTLVTTASPSFTTPVLGVATATSINKLTITAPATSATLTIADGQTLTVNGSATITNGTHSGTNTGDQNVFTTIAVSGQSDVVSDTSSDTLTFVAGSNMTITTNATTDTITFASTGSAGVPTQITVANEATDTTCFPLFVTAATGDLGPKSNVNFTFNSNTGSFGVPSIQCSGIIDADYYTTNTGIEGNFVNPPIFAPSNNGVWTISCGVGGVTPALRLAEDLTNGSHYAEIKPPASIAASYTLTLPSAAGTIALTSDITGTNSGTNTGDQNLFRTIAVSGQSDVVADSTTDTLTLVAGTNITITTDASTDSITINSSGSGGTPTAITVADEGTDTTCFPTFFTAATGDLGPKTNASLTFNSNTVNLSCTTFTGAFVGNVTGNVTGSSGSCTGNAATVTTNANLTGPITSVGNATTIADAELSALAGLTSAANKIPMFSGSGTATLIDFLDEDAMTSNSATAVPSQQSVKAYVDANAGGGGSLGLGYCVAQNLISY